MSVAESVESLNTTKSRLSDFMEDLRGKLTLLTGLVNYEEFGLTLEDVRKPMLIIGKPGIGKTCGIMAIKNELNQLLPPDKQLGFKKIQLGQTVVGSMQGIPVSRPDGTVIRVYMPELPVPGRDPEYGILFLDEITTADEAQIQPALGLGDDSRSLGEYTLPPHWVVVAAGNGPDCTNFIRLDDMTISRFATYDILYDYKVDWRPWAQNHSIDGDIIAFLNFDDSVCVRVESTDMDNAGKLFPCPRTWERLSTELRIRKALGKPVEQSNLSNFAGRVIGAKAAREFASFCAYRSKIKYDPQKICDGVEKPPTAIPKEVYHLLMQGCINELKKRCKGVVPGGDIAIEQATAVKNFIDWFLKFQFIDFDCCLNTFMEIRTIDCIKAVVLDPDFSTFCTSWMEFFVKNEAFIHAQAEQLAKGWC